MQVVLVALRLVFRHVNFAQGLIFRSPNGCDFLKTRAILITVGSQSPIEFIRTETWGGARLKFFD